MRVNDIAKLYAIFSALAFCGAAVASFLDSSASQPGPAGMFGMMSLLLMSAGAWVFIKRDRKVGAILTMVATLTFSWWMVSVVSAGGVSLLVLCAGLMGAFCMVVVAFGGTVSGIRAD